MAVLPWRSALFLLPLFLFLAQPARGSDPDAMQALMGLKGLRCRWDRIAAVKIDGDSVSFDISQWDTSPKRSVNYFLDIDLDGKNRATFVGNLGSTQVRAFATRMGIFFVESSDIGAVHLATIYPYKVGSTGKYLGTLSRNWAVEVPLPSLTYGLCEPWEPVP
ncbi:MAG: hypothetical protein JSV00_03735 [bacterium]|nr:MAG: hypothetical protein JSV00_03735 [bacterium]